jgi:hypothetical protein
LPLGNEFYHRGIAPDKALPIYAGGVLGALQGQNNKTDNQERDGKRCQCRYANCHNRHGSVLGNKTHAAEHHQECGDDRGFEEQRSCLKLASDLPH